MSHYVKQIDPIANKFQAIKKLYTIVYMLLKLIEKDKEKEEEDNDNDYI